MALISGGQPIMHRIFWNAAPYDRPFVDLGIVIVPSSSGRDTAKLLAAMDHAAATLHPDAFVIARGSAAKEYGASILSKEAREAVEIAQIVLLAALSPWLHGPPSLPSTSASVVFVR